MSEEATTEQATEPMAEFVRAESIMQFFAWAHLPPHLQEISIPFYQVASSVMQMLPRNPERTVALRKLLEAKDAAVRSRVFKPAS